MTTVSTPSAFVTQPYSEKTVESLAALPGLIFNPAGVNTGAATSTHNSATVLGLQTPGYGDTRVITHYRAVAVPLTGNEASIGSESAIRGKAGAKIGAWEPIVDAGAVVPSTRQAAVVGTLATATQYVIQLEYCYDNATGSPQTTKALPVTTTLEGAALIPEDDRVVTLVATPSSSTPLAAVNLHLAYLPGQVSGDELEEFKMLVVPGSAPTDTDLRNNAGVTELDWGANTRADDGVPEMFSFSYNWPGDPESAETVTYQALGRRTSNQQWTNLGNTMVFAKPPSESSAVDESVPVCYAIENSEDRETVLGTAIRINTNAFILPAVSAGQSIRTSNPATAYMVEYDPLEPLPPADVSAVPGAFSQAATRVNVANQANDRQRLWANFQPNQYDHLTHYHLQYKYYLEDNSEHKSAVFSFVTQPPRNETVAGDQDDQLMLLRSIPDATSLEEARYIVSGLHLPVVPRDDDLAEFEFLFLHKSTGNETDLRGKLGVITKPTSKTGDATPHMYATFGESDGGTRGNRYLYQLVGRKVGGADAWEAISDVQGFRLAPAGTRARDDQVITAQYNAQALGTTSAQLWGYHLPGTIYGDELTQFGFILRDDLPANPEGGRLDTGTEGVDYRIITATKQGESPLTNNYSGTATGLEPGTQYFVQFFGIFPGSGDMASYGAYGEPVAITTAPARPVDVVATTTLATEIDHDSATLSGILRNTSLDTLNVTYFFEYGTTYNPVADEWTDYAKTADKLTGIASDAAKTVSEVLPDVLDPLTPYVFRLKVKSFVRV